MLQKDKIQATRLDGQARLAHASKSHKLDFWKHVPSPQFAQIEMKHQNL